SASRKARFSSSRCPQELQKRARKWFLEPQEVQRSLSLRLGIATNDPLAPSIILRSRTTKALSKVTEQKACNRSLFSATSLMRTSVMTTAVLLQSLWRPLGLRRPVRLQLRADRRAESRMRVKLGCERRRFASVRPKRRPLVLLRFAERRENRGLR